MIRFKPAATAAVTYLVATAAAAWAQGDETEQGPAAISTVTIEPQTSTLRPKLRTQNLGREAGLPQNNVASIAQDKTGFVWLGTQDGVARYDGQRFVVFRHVPGQANSLSSSFINRLLVAKDGTLWVGTQEGLNRLNRESRTFERFAASDKPGSLTAPIISALAEGPDGRLWIGTVGGGVNLLDPATGKFRSWSTEDGIDPSVGAIHVDADGTAWVGTSQGLFRIAAGKETPEPMFADDEKLATAVITALTRDRKGNLWIGTGGAGLVRYAPDSKKVQIYTADPANWERLQSDDVTAVFEDKSGQIWVGTGGAVQILDPASGAFDRQPVDPDDPRSVPDKPTTFFQDAAGVIWVGTETLGVALIAAGSGNFKAYKFPSNVADLYHKGQDLWFVTLDGSLCRWRGKKVFDGTCYKMPARLTAVLVDSKGTVWAGSMGQGLYRLDAGSKNRWTLYQHDPADPKSVGEEIITSLYEDRSGNLWIGTLGGLPQRFDRAKQQFSTDLQIEGMGVYMIKEDPKEDNVLWFGSADKGLISVHLDTGAVQLFTPSADASNQSDNAVVDFLFDGDQTIWLATYGGGLKKLDRKSGKFKEYRRQQGMPSDTLYAVQGDNAGKLWISSIAGVARFDPKTEQAHIFTAADGLHSNELTINAATRFDDGRIAFGGLKGITVFQPQEVDIDKYSPAPVVTAIDVLGEPYSQEHSPDSIREVSLDYDEATVTVQFAALTFSGSDRLQFEYKMEGASDRWLKTDSSVSLAGLDDGDYTLLLRARNRHGVESKPVALAIVVAPPLWRTWWAYTAYGVTLLGILFGIYRYQQARIDRLQKLARLATVEKEFEITAAVQAWFLPEAQRFSNGICDLIGFYRGAEKCSGDWWWYEDLGRGRLWIIVADVTGHGAGPAMVTAAVAMGLSVQADNPDESVTQRLARVNREVLLRCKGKATMTMTAVVIDQNSGEVVIYGLGGLPALLMGPDGNHMVIGASGTPLGSGERLEIGERNAVLGPGDRLVITTDGIIETQVSGGRAVGFRRVVNVMREVRAMPLEQAVERIVRDVDVARADRPQEDDFTFCVLERHG